MVKRLRTHIDAIGAILGYGLVTAGVAALSPPWALIVSGSLLLAAVFWRVKA